MSAPDDSELSDQEYQQLAGLRLALRRYLRWAEERATDVGLTPAQHQLLLAIRGRGADAKPTVGELADELLLRHHSAVGLIDRAESAGLVKRKQDVTDQRVVRVGLTELGTERLGQLATLHFVELGRLGSQLHDFTTALPPD